MAYGAYDSPTYSIDISPFVPILVDGQPHTISLLVVSDEKDSSINNNWYLSGNIKVHFFDPIATDLYLFDQVALDPSGRPTTGNITRYDASLESKHSVQRIGDNSYNFTVDVKRLLSIEASLVSGSGKKTNVAWNQNLHFTNVQSYLNNASVMVSALSHY